jgi:hypothetical protein
LVLTDQAIHEGLLRFAVRNGVISMCDKCVEIDQRIERYRRILLSINDQITIDRTKELIADLQAKKATFHPEEMK